MINFLKRIYLIPCLLILLKSFDLYNFILSSFIIFNSFLRIEYPSSYYPLTQTQKGFIFSPIFARIIANIAEFIFYFKLTNYYNIDFFNSNFLYIVIIGECFCWFYLLFQCSLFGLIEDFIWLFYHINICYYSSNLMKYILSYPFILYVLFIHLPISLFNLNLSISIYNTNIKIIDNINSYNLSWQIPSLIFKPLCYLLII